MAGRKAPPGIFDTEEELYHAVVNSTRRTQKETARDCGISPTRVSDILAQERIKSRLWRGR
jgi:hypothetical protein